MQLEWGLHSVLDHWAVIVAGAFVYALLERRQPRAAKDEQPPVPPSRIGSSEKRKAMRAVIRAMRQPPPAREILACARIIAGRRLALVPQGVYATE